MNFCCTRCGRCCQPNWIGKASVVRLSAEEKIAISTRLCLRLEDFERIFLMVDNHSINVGHVACHFYDSENKECIINDIKPAQCADFPHGWRQDLLERAEPVCPGLTLEANND